MTAESTEELMTMASPTLSETNTDKRLGIVKRLVEELERAGVRYCHFKSNEHLLAAVSGDTDLDILFDARQQSEVISVLERAGFTAFDAIPLRRYPGIDDFLGIDPSTGKIVHVHAHFFLLAGESGVKSYHIPWEEQILAARRWDDECGIYCSSYAHELLLLLLRTAMKLRWRDVLLMPVGGRIGGDAEREYTWLKKLVSLAELNSAASCLLESDVQGALASLYRDGLRVSSLRQLIHAARSDLESYRRLSRVSALARRIAVFHLKVARKLNVFDAPKFRTARRSGLIICILGSDGAGKSTQTRHVRKMLGRKLDVLYLYMGSGDGASSLLRKPLILLSRLAKIIRRGGGAKKQTTPGAARFKGGFVERCYRLLWAVVLGIERRAKLRRAARARSRGMIVVCDRYPQTNLEGYNDGPLLGPLRQSRFSTLRRIARWEWESYDKANDIPPDLVIKLIGDPTILAKRRPEMAPEVIRAKQEGVERLQFPEHSSVAQIAADRSESVVFAGVMNAIGEEIQSRLR